MFIFTLFMGAGTSFFITDNPIFNPIGFLIFITLILYMIKCIGKIPHLTKLIGMLSIIAFWILYHCFRVGHYDLAFVMFALHIIAAYLIILIYKENIIIYYEKIAYILAFIGLFMWVVNNAISSETMSLLAPFKSSDYNNASASSGSFLLYVTGSWKGAQFMELYRNQGYCWEAGRFASLTSLGLVCYIIKNKGIINFFDKHFLIYVLTILSTFSTTGYITLCLMIGICIIGGKTINLFNRIIISSLLVFAIFYLHDADFLGEKIVDQLDTSNFISKGSLYYSEAKVITVERFEGIYLDWLNFIDQPIMGYGLTDQWSYMQRNINKELITANGITKPLAQYGIILSTLFFISLYNGTKNISKKFMQNCHFLLLLVLISISMSYDFNKTPFILAFSLYGIMYNKLQNDVAK